jgi:hypothetical protein
VSQQPPRCCPQRSLPEREFIPGRGSKPELSDEPAHDALLWGVDLYNHGFAWEAHEAWEGLWRSAKHDEAQATFLQGLIQCAAARVKMSMGDGAATQRLLERGLARLSSVREQHGDRYMGLDLARYLSEHASRAEGAAFPYLWLIGG